MSTRSFGPRSAGTAGPAFHAVPSKIHTSVPPFPPVTTTPRFGSYVMPKKTRGDMPPGAAGPFDQLEPSHSHVSSRGGQSLLSAPPNITSLPMSGSYAMAIPPRGVSPAGAGGP